MVLAPSAQAQDVFYFVDERGVSHFTNRPRDTRYKPFIDSKTPGAVRRDPSPELSLQLSAPGTIKGNSDFPVLVSCPGCASLRGWAEVSYDPSVLILADVSTRYHTLGDGQVRVELTSDHSQAVSSRMLFSSSAYARAPTTLRIFRAELRNEDGQVVEITLPAGAHIVVTEQ